MVVAVAPWRRGAVAVPRAVGAVDDSDFGFLPSLRYQRGEIAARVRAVLQIAIRSGGNKPATTTAERVTNENSPGKLAQLRKNLKTKKSIALQLNNTTLVCIARRNWENKINNMSWH